VNGRLLALLPLLAACAAAPYRPARAALPAPLPSDAFARALAVLRERYPRIELADESGFRLRSAWVAWDHGGTPCRRRATVFRDGYELAVVVEVSVLRFDLFGEPAWSSARGERRFEDELIAALVEALEA
jgi:hypothetical protein